MKNNHRSLLFQYVGKKANNVIASFNEYPKMEPIDILNELQLKYDPTQVEEIILEDHELVVISEELKTKLEEFPNLESLGLNRCDLTTLKNLPDLKHLQRLQLDTNNLKVSIFSSLYHSKFKHLQYLTKYPKLISLSLMSNRFDISELGGIISFLNESIIQQLNLFDNPISKQHQNLHHELFTQVTSLRYFDNLQRTGSEVYYDAEYDLVAELGRNDGEDLKYIKSLLKEKNHNDFNWENQDQKRNKDMMKQRMSDDEDEVMNGFKQGDFDDDSERQVKVMGSMIIRKRGRPKKNF